MLEVVTVDNMRKSDMAKIKSGTSGKDLMWQAALGVYRNVLWHDKIAIVCGTGNNAGDGYALALILNAEKYDVTIILTSDKFSKDGQYYYEKCQQAKLNIKKYPCPFSEYAIIVDALLGTGFKGSLNQKLAEIINAINQAEAYKIAIDINSGLNGDNGIASLAVKSDLTISIGSYKVGHFANMAKDYIDKLINVDIFIPICDKPFNLIEKDDIKSFFKPRKAMSNKGDYGYVGIMGGSKNYPGAIRLANMAQNALYAGCGVAKLIIPNTLYDVIYANVLETVISPIDDEDGKMLFNEVQISQAIKGLKALAVGVGWDKAKEYEKIMGYLIENYQNPLVIDADGINTLARMDLNILNRRNGSTILTPHLKEFARLTGYEVADIQNNLIAYALEFVNKYRVTLLLKGPMTIVCDSCDCYLIKEGNPGMATAGSGDVLTGIITGLLGLNQKNISLTTAVAAFINGYSGTLASRNYGEVGMVAGDTIRMISLAIKELLND